MSIFSDNCRKCWDAPDEDCRKKGCPYRKDPVKEITDELRQTRSEIEQLRAEIKKLNSRKRK